MRISDWSSDVCSSDLLRRAGPQDGLCGELDGYDYPLFQLTCRGLAADASSEMTARRLAHRPQAVKLSRKGKSMVKLVALLKAKEGLSQEEFEKYYEKYHVPLVLTHLTQIANNRRNYVLPDPLLRTQHKIGRASCRERVSQ